MSKPRVSAKKKRELAWARKSLFPPELDQFPEPIADPMGAAWKYAGVLVSHPKHPGYQYAWFRTGKLHVLAVAQLNLEGIPATPAKVTELVGLNAYSVVARKLRMMTQEGWAQSYMGRQGYQMGGFPLTRVKYGRTHAYFIAEPSS